MSKENVRVLVFEDSDAECRIVEDMLLLVEQAHFQVRSVATLADGIHALEKESYDVIILDLHLGQSQGIETLKSVREFAGNIPIVVLSMIADESIALQAMQEGAQDYLFKTQVNPPLLYRSLSYARERARSQEALRLATLEWDRTFNAITDSIMLIDTDFNIKRVNKATFTLFGLPPEDIVGRKCYDVVHRLNKPWPDCPFGQTQTDFKAHATEIVDPQTQRCYLVSSSPIFDSDGGFLGTVHVARDITERKKTERYLERRIHDLEIFHKAAVDRELVMVQLKKRLKEMESKVRQREREHEGDHEDVL